MPNIKKKKRIKSILTGSKIPLDKSINNLPKKIKNKNANEDNSINNKKEKTIDITKEDFFKITDKNQIIFENTLIEINKKIRKNSLVFLINLARKKDKKFQCFKVIISFDLLYKILIFENSIIAIIFNNKYIVYDLMDLFISYKKYLSYLFNHIIEGQKLKYLPSIETKGREIDFPVVDNHKIISFLYKNYNVFEKSNKNYFVENSNHFSLINNKKNCFNKLITKNEINICINNITKNKSNEIPKINTNEKKNEGNSDYKENKIKESDNVEFLLSDYKPKGLKNFRTNCYMNSLIQCLFYVKKFRTYFIINNFDIYNSMNNAIKDVMVGLNSTKNYYYSPSILKNKLNENENFLDGYPADVTDLLDFIFTSIIEEQTKSENESLIYDESRNDDKKETFENIYREVNFDIIINKLFLGFYEKEMKCKNGHSYFCFQYEYKIEFPLESILKHNKNKKNIDLYDCFKHYERIQYNVGDFCDKCGEEYNLIERIYRLPEILIIILDRGENKKIKNKIIFPQYLNLKNYIDEKDYKFNSKYKLIGVSTHLGSNGKTGHYISYCCGDDHNYYCFNDDYVYSITSSEDNYKLNVEKLHEGSPYVLFYQREEKNIDICETVMVELKKYLKNSIFKKLNKYYPNRFTETINDLKDKIILWKDNVNDNEFKIDLAKFLDKFVIDISLTTSNYFSDESDEEIKIYEKSTKLIKHIWDRDKSLEESIKNIIKKINICLKNYLKNRTCGAF